jgi:hypothetical protein
LERLDMEGASCAPRRVGPVQDDAGTVDDPSARPSVVREDAVLCSRGVVLEPRRVHGRRQRGDVPGLVLTVESGTDGAATLPEVFGRPRENADAAPAPDARQFDLRKDASNRQIVSPSTTSSDPFLSYR